MFKTIKNWLTGNDIRSEYSNEIQERIVVRKMTAKPAKKKAPVKKTAPKKKAPVKKSTKKK